MSSIVAVVVLSPQLHGDSIDGKPRCSSSSSQITPYLFICECDYLSSFTMFAIISYCLLLLLLLSWQVIRHYNNTHWLQERNYTRSRQADNERQIASRRAVEQIVEIKWVVPIDRPHPILYYLLYVMRWRCMQLLHLYILLLLQISGCHC